MTQAPPETKIVDKKKIACDGGDGGEHPRVWLTIPDDKGYVDCPYCGARYALEGAADTAA